MKRAAPCLRVAAAAVGAAICLSACGPARESVTLAGSTAFAPFAEKLAEQYMAGHGDVNIRVQAGGSSVGIQAALSGVAQIGMADLVALPPEAKALTSLVIARDGIAVIVNPANKVSDLTTGQLRDIFNGKTDNWKQVGGEDKPITVISREAGSGTRSSFEQIVGGLSLSGGALVQNASGAIAETVANDAGAIGYVSHGLVNDKIKAISVDGKECTVAEIKAGNYTLVRPIYLLTKGPPAGKAAQFMEYAMSDEGQAILAKDGLVPAK